MLYLVTVHFREDTICGKNTKNSSKKYCIIQVMLNDVK